MLNGDGQHRLGTLSNAEGYYAIPGITEDFCVIIASYIGYETFRDTLQIANRNNVRVDIELKRTALQLGEVLVEADLNNSSENNLNVRPSIASLKVRDIKQMAAMGEPDRCAACSYCLAYKALQISAAVCMCEVEGRIKRAFFRPSAPV